MEWELMSPLPEADRARVLASTQRKRYARDAVVFHEDDPGDVLHLVCKGRLAVRLSLVSGEALTLSVLSPGDAFGELAVVGEPRRRTASVVAWEDSETLSISGAGFRTLCRQHPRVEGLMMTLLSERVDRLSHRLLEAVYVAVEPRVCRRLVELCDIYAGRGGGVAASIPLTQDDLAGIVGTSRQTVNQVLGRLSADRIISLSRGHIDVVDREALRRLAEP